MNRYLRNFLLSGLVGAGAYGGSRLYLDASKKILKEPESRRLDKAMLKLPATRKEEPKVEDKPKTETTETKDELVKQGFIMNILKELGAAAAGSAVGFYGAKAVYDKVRERQLKAELDRQEKDYLAALREYQNSELGVKAGSATSLVDIALEGLLEKQGSFQKWLLGTLGAGTMAGGGYATGKYLNLPEELRAKMRDVNAETDSDLQRNTMSMASNVFGELKPLAATMVLGTAAYTAYKLMEAKKKQQEQQLKRIVPVGLENQEYYAI